jgi:PAS domain S-box-containing protein
MTERRSDLLLVDDEPANLDMLSRRLQRAGYCVATAAGGQEALDRIADASFDLVLLDVQMPGLGGLQVLKAIRERHPAHKLPVVMVTARVQSEDIVVALEAGANDYVTKPVDFAVMLARVRTQLDRCAAERALAESEERYALAVRGANDGLWDWRAADGETYLSPRWKEILGYQDDELPNALSSWLDRVHPDDLERVRAELDRHLNGQSAQFESEHRVRHRSGIYRWALVRGVGVRDREGRVSRMAGSLTDITEGKVADPLTGLANRLQFVDRLERVMEQGRRHPDLLFAVIFLDLDRFKNVNDSLGHGVGDALLVQVAARLQQCLRGADGSPRPFAGPGASREDTVARLGGDEFAILLTGVRSGRDAEQVVERVLASFADPFEVCGRKVDTTASVGIALSRPDYTSAAELLRDADTAMYHAKGAGRGRAATFDETMRAQAVRRFELEGDIREALDAGQFLLHYQPIVSLRDRCATGLEALIRWNHPTYGLVGPDEFIGIAEETGTIVSLGDWTVRTACRQLRAWSDEGLVAAPFTVGVNLSRRQLIEPDLASRMAGIAAECGVAPASVEFEIAEACMLAEPETATAVLGQLKAAGFRLSIDDFGAGYSAVSYVHHFAIDRIKIDRTFLGPRALTRMDDVMSSIVSLAEHLDVELVAEGVETVEEVERLEGLRCSLCQGFFFSRPADARATEAMLRAPGDVREVAKSHTLERALAEPEVAGAIPRAPGDATASATSVSEPSVPEPRAV